MRFFAHLQHVVQFFTTLVLPRNVFLMSEDDAVECGQNRTNTQTHTHSLEEVQGVVEKGKLLKNQRNAKVFKVNFDGGTWLEIRIEKVRRKLKQSSGTLKSS